jgi:hypothetical protein
MADRGTICNNQLWRLMIPLGQEIYRRGCERRSLNKLRRYAEGRLEFDRRKQTFIKELRPTARVVKPTKVRGRAGRMGPAGCMSFQ